MTDTRRVAVACVQSDRFKFLMNALQTETSASFRLPNGDWDRLLMFTWIRFLRFLDDLEIQHDDEVKLAGG